MKKGHERPSAFRSIAWRVIALALAFWLALCGLLTWAVAADFYREMENDAREFVVSHMPREPGNQNQYGALSGSMESEMIDTLGHPYYFLRARQLLPIVLDHLTGYSSDDWLWGKWDLIYNYEAAVIFYDENGEELLSSGNYLTFVYTDEIHWINRHTDALGYGYVDLDSVAGGMAAFENLLSDVPCGDYFMDMFIPLLRLRGYFEGSEFHPVSIDRGDYFSIHGSTTLETLCRVDGMGNVDWENVLTVPEVPDRELETIYAWEAGGIRSSYGSVTADGTRFETLTDLLRAVPDAAVSYERESLLDAVIIWRGSHEDAYGKFDCAIAVRCWPLLYALLRLWPTYLVSFALGALAVYLLLRRVRNSLTQPLEWLLGGYYPTEDPRAWKEPRLLQQKLTHTDQCLAEARNEIKQLRTALDYARSAEENRRLLVSNLTHELKTPLAIIHSYAEGLQAGIAPEKQKQYLEVILEEAERMDALVLQMLDLSRLEAGKVRLARDRFCLLTLTKTLVQRLQPGLEARELTVRFGFEEPCTVTADESRIAQVITNLLTNALRYTTPGGDIWIRIFRSQGAVHFYIENAAPHLPPEALDRVFDSFYRADTSRRTEGTGLGLAISRSIVELHRGEITVKNTYLNGKPYVEFHFSLPDT